MVFLFRKIQFAVVILSLNLNVLSAQEINWSNLSIGGVFQYSFTHSDLKEYWGDFPSAGIAFEYTFTDDFSLETSLSASYLKSTINSDEIPDIFLINIPGGFKYYFLSVNDVAFNFFTGLTSSTFAFTGPAAERLGDNYIESEFGIFASLGTGYYLYKKLILEIFFSGQSVFTAPESILLYNVGVKIFWK